MSFSEYRNYLKVKADISEGKISYYLGWVTRFFAFCKKSPGELFSQNDIHAFLDKLGRQHEAWQVNQAKEAIEIYRFLLSRKSENNCESAGNSSGAWKRAADEMVNMLRLKQRSYRTEKTYMAWLRDFYRFSGNVSPDAIDDRHLKDYLTYLAVERSVESRRFDGRIWVRRLKANQHLENRRRDALAPRRRL